MIINWNPPSHSFLDHVSYWHRNAQRNGNFPLQKTLVTEVLTKTMLLEILPVPTCLPSQGEWENSHNSNMFEQLWLMKNEKQYKMIETTLVHWLPEVQPANLQCCHEGLFMAFCAETHGGSLDSPPQGVVIWSQTKENVLKNVSRSILPFCQSSYERW